MMTRKPVSQGNEDGLSGLYSIVNALALLFPVAMTDDLREMAFKRIAVACNGSRWPAILWDGTTYTDIRHMLHGARNYLNSCDLKFDWEQPFAKHTIGSFDDFARELKWRIDGDDAFGIVGISKPWSHWTCAHRLTPHEMIMTDSCHVKHISLAKCGLTGDGTDYEFDFRQTFTLTRAKK